MGTIRFELRKEKATRDGNAPIRLIYQIRSQRKYYNTGIKLLPFNWNEKGQYSVYKSKKEAKEVAPTIPYHIFLTDDDVKAVNNSLSNLVADISDIEKLFKLKGVTYGCEDVIEALKTKKNPETKKDESSELLYEFIEKYIEEHKSIREDGSLQVYRSLKKHLQDYQKHTRQKVTFSKIDFSFFQAFQTFLATGAGVTTNKLGKTVARSPLSNTTTAKQLSTIKTFLNYARKSGAPVTDKYKDFTIKRESLEVISLTNSEFETLFFLDLTNNKKLSHVRDVFCLGCTTGLRYSDLAQLRREHIKQDEIKLTVTKTKQPLSIPLTPFSRIILERYQDQLKPIPIISNQKLNDYVKELCKLAGIVEQVEIVRFQGKKRIVNVYPKYELLGTHTGRKTFATLSLEKGMSAEQVMAIGGWKDYKSFKRYVNVTDQLKKAVMLKAWGGGLRESKLKAVS